MYTYMSTIDTEDINLKVYKFQDINNNIFGVILEAGTDIDIAKQKLLEYLTNDSPLGLS